MGHSNDLFFLRYDIRIPGIKPKICGSVPIVRWDKLREAINRVRRKSHLSDTKYFLTTDLLKY